MTRQVVVCKTDDDEENGEYTEAHDLNWLSANGIDSSDRDPVTWDGTSTNQNQITNGRLAEDLIHVGTARPADSRQNDGIIKGETVVGDIEEEP